MRVLPLYGPQGADDAAGVAHDATGDAQDAAAVTYDAGGVTYDASGATYDAGTTSYDAGSTSYDAGGSIYDAGGAASEAPTITMPGSNKPRTPYYQDYDEPHETNVSTTRAYSVTLDSIQVKAEMFVTTSSTL